MIWALTFFVCISPSILFWQFSVENLPIFYYFYDWKKNTSLTLWRNRLNKPNIFSQLQEQYGSLQRRVALYSRVRYLFQDVCTCGAIQHVAVVPGKLGRLAVFDFILTLLSVLTIFWWFIISIISKCFKVFRAIGLCMCSGQSCLLGMFGGGYGMGLILPILAKFQQNV